MSNHTTAQLVADIKAALTELSHGASYPDLIAAVDTLGARAGDGKTLTLPYSMDLDPAGIRALVSDAISGALALGAQNESPAPEGHWLGHFWQLGRQHDEWRAVARALNCLPSTFSDANGHVLRAAERLMAERAAAPAVSAPAWQPIETAPTDGSTIMYWVSAVRYEEDEIGGIRSIDVSAPDFGCWVNVAADAGYHEPFAGIPGDNGSPTHWMPLPAAPTFAAPVTGDAA